MRSGRGFWFAAALVCTAIVTGTDSGSVSAAPSGTDQVVAFIVRGVGNGHGRGMSQWGAYGRAVNGGQSWQTILDSYYGGTSNGNRSEPNLRVRLTDWDDSGSLGVISVSGQARWQGSATGYTSLYAVETAPNQFSVFGSATRGCPGAASIAVPMVDLVKGSANTSAVRQLQSLLNHFGASPSLTVDGGFGNLTEAALKTFQTASGVPADGQWHVEDWTAAQTRLAAQGTIAWTPLATGVTGPVVFSTSVAADSASGDVLGACEPSGSITHYRGTLELADIAGPNRIINQVDVELYLRGVVPKESSASWGAAGNGAGMNALRAQAVAARSFALSQNRYSYAKTCDTTSCQVYGGSATRPSATSAGIVTVEHPLTNQAIAETATVVRIKNGSVVSTEFSASNGPRTAGGSFPAVDDPWDDVPGNPNHRWTRIIDADAIAGYYGLSNANNVATVNDPGVNFDGIWDNKVVSGSTKLATAWDFRNAFDLPSPGFELIPVRRDVATPKRMAWIGDSVGVSVAGQETSPLRILLEGVFSSVSYDSLGARPTQGGSNDGVAAANAVPLGTELVVVELGYNDSPSAMSSRIDAVMTALTSRGVSRVAWINVSERRTSTSYATTNAAISAAAGRWSNLVVLDWESASDDAPGDRWFADGVHLSSTGRAEFSLFVRDRILGLVPSSSPRSVVPGVVLRVPVLDRFGVPGSGVVGVALNVTAVDPAAAGWLRVWPCGSPEPDTSSVNFAFAGAVEPNAVVVPVDATGEVCVVSSAASEVVVDVSGWFDSGLRQATGRLLDTRLTDSGRSVVPGVVLRVPVLDRFGVPGSGVVGVALNVTAVDPAAAGWLRVWPCGSPEPDTSSVNFAFAGAVEPNAVVVPVDATGEVCVVSSAASEVVVDVSGWFDSGLRQATGRLLDTRLTDSGRSVVPGVVLRVPVLDRFGVPGSGVVGVALNVTAVDPAAAGWLRVWPCGSPEPDTSSVNFAFAGAVEPNAVVVPVDATGEVCVVSSAASEVVVDVSGWFDSGLRQATGRLLDTRND